MINEIRFINKSRSEFFTTLRQRVDDYFNRNKLKKSGNYQMILKTIAMLALYFVPYGLILSGIFSPWVMFGLAAVMGLGMAGIGLSIMHDANHGAYSSSPRINKLVGHTLNLIGGSVFIWKTKHNLFHHDYTNIEGKDEDINSGGLMRLSPNTKLRYFHKYQHIYAWFFYSLLTLNVALKEDFMKLHRYNKTGITSQQGYDPKKELYGLLLAKIVYFGYILVIPLLLLDISWWQVLIGFLTMHLISSLTLSAIFQTAHVVEETSHPSPDKDGNMKNEWAIHQLRTTADFAKKNSVLSWFIGGLNFQVEHHLFPKICHIHYKKISDIVKKTAEEYRLKYNSYPSFVSAIASHTRLLKKLGRNY
ncbi:MAG TPA: acyl-CoA desaturase [Candidatus Nanoarchaeia archaeon]|nr:acyl-CoA desaturase [Candidatus Nanoarchaeia archaeon]